MLGTFGVLDPPDPSVLLVFVLRSVRHALVGGDVREYFIVILSSWFVIVVALAERGHVDVMLQGKLSARAVVDEYCPALFLLDDGSEGLAFLKRQFFYEGHKVGVEFK
jgi:hypothetical protein